MIWTNIKRIIKSGFVHFWRNGVISLASILVVSVTLFVIGSLVIFDATLKSSLATIEDKVDVNIYFNVSATEEDILPILKSLENLPEVKSVEYISREQALLSFKDRHSDDQLILQALDELDDNPLGASLNVKAKETSQYESIAKFLDSKSALSAGGNIIIDKINYYQNKIVIDRLIKIISGAERIGFALTALLIIISVIITFNTIRLAIYISRDEISVMKLVGASNGYVRGPFIVEGVMYGIISSIIAIILFYPITLWLGDATENFFGGINIFTYYLENFAQLFFIMFVSGIFLGIISSYMAVRKYLKV